MTLPTTGAISFNDIITELGKTSGTAISLNDADVRALTTKSTGAISMSDFYGASSQLFSPEPGTYEKLGVKSASMTITCSKPCLWTYTGGSGKTSGTSPSTSGTTSNSFYMSVGATQTEYIWTGNSDSWSVTGTVDGVDYHWEIDLNAEGTQ